MKLSEAIRLAAMATEPVHGPMFRGGYNGEAICATCGLGAPLYALFGDDALTQATAAGPMRLAWHAKDIVRERWPWTAERQRCPLCPSNIDTADLLLHLFEGHFLTREQIADWVESVENSLNLPDTQPRAEESESAVDSVARDLESAEAVHARI